MTTTHAPCHRIRSRAPAIGLGLLLLSSAAAGEILIDVPVEDAGWDENDVLWSQTTHVTPPYLEGQRSADMNHSNPSGTGDRVSRTFPGDDLEDALYTACFGMGNQYNYPFPSAVHIDFAGLPGSAAIAALRPTPPSGDWVPWSFTFDGNDDLGAPLGFAIEHGAIEVTNMRFDGLGPLSAQGSGFVVTRFATSTPDADGDGVLDPFDNCVNVYNPHQVDANDDGFGNVCDLDFNDDLVVGAPDFSSFVGCFGQAVPIAGPPNDPLCLESDTRGSSSGFPDLFVGVPDFAPFVAAFGNTMDPETSGLCCAGGTKRCEAPARIYAATDAGLAISNDDGRSWRVVTAPELPSNDVLAVDAQANRVVVATSSGIAVSEDSGANWVTTGVVPPDPIVDVDLAGNRVLVATTQSVNRYAWSPGGPFVPDPMGSTLYSVYPATGVTSVAFFDRTVLVGTESDGLAVSEDDGATWAHYTDGDDDFPSSGVQDVFVGAEHSGWIAATDRDRALFHPNLAAPLWDVLEPGLRFPTGSVHADELIVVSETSGTVDVSADYGQSWWPLDTYTLGFTTVFEPISAVYTHAQRIFVATPTEGLAIYDYPGGPVARTEPNVDGFPSTNDVRDVVYR